MSDLKAANAKRWANAKVTRNFSGIAKSLVAAKARYQAVEAKTGVPWFVIAVIHERESSQNFGRSLAQGDPITRPSVHVPAGRPAGTWEAVAVDALVNCPPYAARNKDWSAGGTLALLERYNGLGYFSMGVPSPYVWAGTNQYKSGKYVADHEYNPDVIDSQPGCAGMILAMMALDPSIKMGVAPTTSVAKKSTGAVVAGGGAATAAHQAGLSVGWIVGIGLAVAVAAFLIWKFKK